jgi:hypothetical protein
VRQAKGRRIDARGRTAEDVLFTVIKVVDRVSIFIRGNGPEKHYEMPADQWRELKEET